MAGGRSGGGRAARAPNRRRLRCHEQGLANRFSLTPIHAEQTMPVTGSPVNRITEVLRLKPKAELSHATIARRWDCPRNGG